MKNKYKTLQNEHVIFDVKNEWWSSQSIKGWHTTEFSITELRKICLVGDENLP